MNNFITRFYLPTLGRFTQPDSIIPSLSNSQAWNRYAYALNNPVKYTDPSGHFPEEPPNPAKCPDGDCSLYPLPSGGGGNNGSGGGDQPGHIEENLTGEISTSEITGFAFYGEFGAKWFAFLPVFLFSHNRVSGSPAGLACITKGADSGKCSVIVSVSGGKGLNLPGIAEGSVDGGFSLLLNTYELSDLAGVDFEVGVELDFQALAELGVGVSYSAAITPDGHFAKDDDGNQIGALNFELGAGLDAGTPTIDGAVFTEISKTWNIGVPVSIWDLLSSLYPYPIIYPNDN